jgi:DNA-binding CsgD family transcriptional regulator
MNGLSVPFTGRHRELESLDRFAADLDLGDSRSLLLTGEPGVGKTTLLDRFLSLHPSVQFITCSGVDCEMELAWAALHQLCVPLMKHLPKIPPPQAAVLQAAFGLGGDGVPDPFLCGLALLSLLTEAAEAGPVVCVVDDAYALDRESLKTLGFAGRRLRAARVGMLFAVREIPRDLAKIPVLHVEPMDKRDAGSLLDHVAHIRLDPAVRERVLAETAGNPLAIVEFSDPANVRRLRGGYDIPVSGSTRGPIEASFLDTARSLHPDSQKLLLIAAADPTGDTALLQRAVLAGGIHVPAEDEQILSRLITSTPVVRFRHPLVRSAIYDSASAPDRRAAHAALATAYGAEGSSDRRVWHLAQSLDAPDAAVADQLEHSAIRARERGGWAGTAAFLERAAQLTEDPDVRARRELDAASASFRSGDPARTLMLLDLAQARASDPLLSARAKLLRGQLTLYLFRGADGPALLLDAARALKPLDPELSSETYLEAVQAAGYAGRLTPGVSIGSIAHAVLAEAPAIEPVRPVDLLRDATAVFNADGTAAATPLTRATNRALLESHPAEDDIRWITLGTNLALETLDDEFALPLAERGFALARRTSMLSFFVIAGWLLVGCRILRGDLAEGEALLREVTAVADDIGMSAPNFAAPAICAWRGRIAECEDLAAQARAAAEEANEGHVAHFLDAIGALLYNGYGEHRRALGFCKTMLESANPKGGFIVAFEYAEAASKAGAPEEIAAAREFLAALTASAQTGWGRGLRALGEALVGEADDHESRFREAITEYARTRMRPYLGRTHLLYGEWLYSQGRPHDGQHQMRLAYDILSDIGATAFAERASRHLGRSTANGRERPASEILTPQELQIARMAASGMSNREIAEQLYLSHRTVASHLYRAFPKLGITSRNQLHVALQDY